MPFTPAHIAAVLPLRRLKFIWSALVVGSMAPDFEYFLRLAPDRGYGHTLAGTFFLTLPLALSVLWLFHAFIKRPLIGLLPESMQRRFNPRLGELRVRGAADLVLIGASTLLGIVTHLVWDSFTHAGSWPYRNWSVLREPVKLAIVGTIPLFNILQHVSSLLGMVVLAIWLFAQRGNVQPVSGIMRCSLSPVWKRAILLVMVMIALLGAVVRATNSIGIPVVASEKRWVGLFIATAIGLIWWQLLLYGFVQTKLVSKPVQ